MSNQSFDEQDLSVPSKLKNILKPYYDLLRTRAIGP